MQKYSYARYVGRRSSPNTVTVEASNEQEAFALAADKLGTRNIRLYSVV